MMNRANYHAIKPERHLKQKVVNFEPSASTCTADYFKPGLCGEPMTFPSGESCQEHTTSCPEPQVIAPENDSLSQPKICLNDAHEVVQGRWCHEGLLYQINT
jgi:hypothetical protein